MELITKTYYVTSRGSVKGPRGLLSPGDVFPQADYSVDYLEKLVAGGTLCTDIAEAFTVQEPIQQPLPTNEAGSDEVTPPPAKVGRSDDKATREVLRKAKRTEAVEVLGAGPRRIENNEILPVTEIDPSNITIADKTPSLADMAGQNLSVEEARALKN